MTRELTDQYLRDWGVIFDGWLSGQKPKREASTHYAKKQELRPKSNGRKIESAKKRFLKQVGM